MSAPARSAVGVACFSKDAALDGMNGAGLSAGAFHVSGFAGNGTDGIERTLATVASGPSLATHDYRTCGEQSLRRVSLRLLDEANRSRVLPLPAGPSTGDTPWCST